MSTPNLPSLIWSVADLLRGDFKQSEYGRVILPFTVLRRLDCVLAPTKAEVLRIAAETAKKELPADLFLKKASGVTFYNTSKLDLALARADSNSKQLRERLFEYIQGFSEEARDIFDRFDFLQTIDRLDRAELLYSVTDKFLAMDMHPSDITTHDMGAAFEELIRKFAELSNETAGEHFTPREVVRLIVRIVFSEDEALKDGAPVRTIYDPTAGTGGMISTAAEEIVKINPKAKARLYGQELNDESYAVCKADMLIRGQEASNIKAGNTLTQDGLPDQKFDCMFSNPPFGVDWNKIIEQVRAEHKKGYNGRFGPGLPRVSDGSLLFLMHLVSKMRQAPKGGSRIGIVLNGSPLFTGGAGSGESEIRRYLFEQDLVEAIIALPTDMFYNTGIATYIWVLTNKKPKNRLGKVQLIDASGFWQKTRKALGQKRREMNEEHLAEIQRLFKSSAALDQAIVLDAAGKEQGRTVLYKGVKMPNAPQGGKVKVVPVAKVFDNKDFGYSTLTIERPLLDAQGQPVLATKGKAKGQQQADPSKRDTENVPLSEDIEAYFKREVLPYAPDAWIDDDKTKVGYEIAFNRHFYVFEAPRPLTEIDAEIKDRAGRIMKMIEGLAS